MGSPPHDSLALIDLGLENEQQLARLRRALVLKSGFQLVLLEVSQPNLGREVLRRLSRWSGTDGVPVLTVVKTRPGRDPVAALEGVAAGAILVGIDRPFDVDPLDGDAPNAGLGDPIERSMTTLNWYRDRLPSLVQGPLVVMLSPDGLRRLFVHAPDLLSWRAHTTRVTAPWPVDLEIRPRPDRRTALEEKAWLERMIAAPSSDSGGPLSRALPGWLIRLGEIEAREGGPWEEHFARAEELAAGRRDILFRLELARARRALDEERYEDAGIHESRAVEQISDSLDTNQEWEATRGTLGRGAQRREMGRVSHDLLFAELRVVRAERLFRTGDVEQAAAVAESALSSARASGDLALVIAALGIVGAIASHRGDHLEATSRFGELREVARVARDQAAEDFARTRLAELTPEAERARPASPAVSPPTAEVSEVQVSNDGRDDELASLESEFIALDAPGDAPERLDLLDRLARAYTRLGRRRDAGLCHARAVWESPAASSQVRLEAWVASELRAAGAETIGSALERILADEQPQVDDVRLVAAIAAHASESVARDPRRVQHWLDRFDDELDARTLWLSHLGLAHLPGGNRLDLVRTRDRILGRLAGGLPAERELPAFLRLGGRGGALGLANGELLSRSLEDLAQRITETQRKRLRVEAPLAWTNAYAAFQLGHGFARIGRHERARELTAEATAVLARVAADPVHGYLIDAFTARIEQAIAGAPPETPLPDALRTQLADLDRVARYKVDRLREASRILEPVERPDAVGAFSKQQKDARGPEFAALGAIADPARRAREVDKLVEIAGADAGERERLVAGMLDVLLELPETQAVPIFARTWPLIAKVAVERRAILYAEALVVASHFGRMELVPELLEYLGVAIRAGAEASLERVLEQSLRALRRIGLRKETSELLAEVERAVPPAHLRTRLALAAGIAFLGDFARAAPTFEQGRRALDGERHPTERLKLIRALATAYSQTPLPTALRGIAELAGQLRDISDSFGTNSHYCLSVLHFVDSLVLGITSDDLALGETGRRFVEDDEHLIRRRLHRDLRDP